MIILFCFVNLFTLCSLLCFAERVAIPPRTKLLTTGSPRPSAHLTLRDSGLQGEFASMFGCVLQKPVLMSAKKSFLQLSCPSGNNLNKPLH